MQSTQNNFVFKIVEWTLSHLLSGKIMLPLSAIFGLCQFYLAFIIPYKDDFLSSHGSLFHYLSVLIVTESLSQFNLYVPQHGFSLQLLFKVSQTHQVTLALRFLSMVHSLIHTGSAVSARALRIIKGLEHPSYDERLGMLSLEKAAAQRILPMCANI